MKNMIMTLKDKTVFPIAEITYTKMFQSDERAYIFRVACQDSENIQQLFTDVKEALTEDNISEVVIGVEDKSRPDNTFNFTKVHSVDFNITDSITVVEVIIE